jgi:hypothetical protein
MVVALSTTQGEVEPKIDDRGGNGGRNGGRNRGGNWNGNSGGGGGGGIGNFGSGGSWSKKPTEYEITKEAYEALLEKWNYADGRIPLVSFEDKNYNGKLIINFISENFEPFFELEGQQLKDTIALVLLKFLLNLTREESFKTETIKAINIFATVTGNKINYEEGKEVFSIGKNPYDKYYFLPNQALIDLEIKSILENNDTNAFYYQFYKFLAANLKEDDILTRLDYFCKSEPLKTKLPEFVIEIEQIKQRIKGNKSLEYVIFGEMAREEKFPNINCLFDPDQWIKDIKNDIKESSPQAFIQDIKDTIIYLSNKVKELLKNKNSNHLVYLFNKIIVYLNSPYSLLGLDSKEILPIFAEMLKINGTNTENIPKIVDYYLKILCSSFVRELDGDINKLFKKSNNLPITQVPYLEDKIILMRRGIEENPNIVGIAKDKALFYLTSLEDKLSEYKTFFQTNINASSAQLAKLLTDAIKEDDERIKTKQEPTAFKETFEKIARLLFLKSCYKGQEIDVNSAEFKEKFEKFKPLPIAEILKNEYVQEYLKAVLSNNKSQNIIEIVFNDRPFFDKIKDIGIRLFSPSTSTAKAQLIILEVRNNGIPITTDKTSSPPSR